MATTSQLAPRLVAAPVAEGSVVLADHLTKRFGDLLAVDDLSFSLDRGTVTGFLGPNGAGKITTLRTLLHLVEPTDLDHHRLAPRGHRLTVVIGASRSVVWARFRRAAGRAACSSVPTPVAAPDVLQLLLEPPAPLAPTRNPKPKSARTQA